MRASFILCPSVCILLVRLIVFFENPQQQFPVRGFRNRMTGRRCIPLMIQQQCIAVEGVAELFGGDKIIRKINALRRDILISEYRQLQRIYDAVNQPECEKKCVPSFLCFRLFSQRFAVFFDCL